MATIEITAANILDIVTNSSIAMSSTKVSQLCGFSKNNAKVKILLDQLVSDKKIGMDTIKGVVSYFKIGSQTSTITSTTSSTQKEMPKEEELQDIPSYEIPSNLPSGYSVTNGDEEGVYVVGFPDGKFAKLNPGERAIVIIAGSDVKRFKFKTADRLLELLHDVAKQFKHFIVKDIILSDNVTEGDLMKNKHLLNILEISRQHKANKINK